ncbi:MAG: hypothetical protein ACI9FJ_001969 [Alteromonadaceae bacterium]|jgi:hypothetical protein
MLASNLARNSQIQKVFVFSERFDNSRRETFLGKLKAQYPYQTRVVDRSGALEDGGVFTQMCLANMIYPITLPWG